MRTFLRTPRETATDIYDRCGKYGVAQQQSVLKQPWHEVIGVYQGLVTSGHAGPGEFRDRVIDAMEAKILELGLMEPESAE